MELHPMDLHIHRFHRINLQTIAISLPKKSINGRDVRNALFLKLEFRLLSADNRILLETIAD
jgi:hypothetical protein